MPSHRLPPVRRIRRRNEFQHVFECGQRIHGRYLTLVAAGNGGPRDRLGIVASKKLGGAVTRNKAKRLIREMFRRQNCEEAGRVGADIVVIPRAGMADVPFADLVKDFESSLRRLPRPSNP
jgi:ribonuclease P protein component